ncbi:uncharacterized protein LOC117121669 isoform X2 [Anneissia japonica]|uniref:uncharacterized protein LOC117121669 isoform X2 n=1 Tax=Anneissia japonica TaxID=1529436 RepID=UPI00142564DB|nr:uncharacterized protein LOC117121669 isoform X2 [Anneissia japonica]
MESRKTVNKLSLSEHLRNSSVEGVTDFRSLPATLSNPNSLNDEELASVPIVSTNLKDAFLDKICFRNVSSLDRWKTFSGLDPKQNVPDKQRDAFHEDQDSISSGQTTDGIDSYDEDLESDNAETCIKDNTTISNEGENHKVDENNESIHSIEMQIEDLPRIKLGSFPSKQPSAFEMRQDKCIHHKNEIQIRNVASTAGKESSGDECATCGKQDVVLIDNKCDNVRCQPFDEKCNDDSDIKAQERKDHQPRVVKEIKTSDKDLSKINPNFQESRFKQSVKQEDEKNVSKEFEDDSEKSEHHYRRRQDSLLRDNKTFAGSKCVVCGVQDATLPCDTCEDARCETCDIKWHNHSGRKMYQRKDQMNSLSVIQMHTKELPNIRLHQMTQELGNNDQPSTKKDEKKHQGDLSQFQVQPKRPLMKSDEDVQDNKPIDDKCVICGIKDAIIHCEVCGDSKCETCDMKWHTHSERKMHQRKDKPNVITMQIQDLPNIRVNPSCQKALFNQSGNQESEAITPKELDTSENIRSPQNIKVVKSDNSDSVFQDKCAACGIKDAIVSCNTCGDARCQPCDVKWHTHVGREKHQRSSQPNLENKIIMRVTELPNIIVHPSFSEKPLVSKTKRGMCMTCGMEEATFIFDIYGDARCQQCDVKLHSHSSRNTHLPSRQPVMSINIEHTGSNSQFEGSAISRSYVKSEDIPAFSKKQSEALQSKPAYPGHESKAVGKLERNQFTEKKDPCVLCGVEDATVPCAECGDARCVQCDEKWHRHKKRNKHQRNQDPASSDSGSLPRNQSHVELKTKKIDLPTNKQNQQEPDNAENKPLRDKCVTCKLKDAIIECDDCEDARCQSCHLKWHSHSNTSMHRRKDGINLENNIQKHIKIFDMKFDAPHMDYEGNVTDEKPKPEAKPTEKKQPCVLCGVEDAIIPCDECGDARCVQCDTKWHRHKKRDKHKRNQVVVSTDSIGSSSSSSSSDSTCSPPLRGALPSRHTGLRRNDQTNHVKSHGDFEVVNNIPASGHSKGSLKNEIYPQTKSDKTKRQHQQLSQSNQNHEIIMNIKNLPMIRDDSRPHTSPAQSRKCVRDRPKEDLTKEKELCVLCGVEDVAVPCDECGDARCIQCDVKWHRHKKRNTHKRNHAVESTCIPKKSHEEDLKFERSIDEQRNCRQTINLIASEKNDFSDQGLGEDIELCALCGQVDGTIECIECKDSRCAPCDKKWHSNAKRKMHQRRASDILEEIVEQDIDPNSPPKTSRPNNIEFSNESRDINSGTYLKKIPVQGASSVERTDINAFPSNKEEPLKDLLENYESPAHVGDADVQLSIPLDKSFNNAAQTLKSKNENISKELNSIQIKLDAMDREHYTEEYDALVTKKSELLQKQKMLMVRMKAIEAIEITNSRQGRTTSLLQGELISLGMHDHSSEQFSRKKPGAFSKSLSAHTHQIVDDDIFADGPSEHENVPEQQGIVLNQDDDKHMIQEAKRRGFTTDDIHIAKAQCEIFGGNFLHWLELNYKEFIASVRASATRDLHRLIPSVKIAESSVIRALVKHRGDVRKATSTCVRKVEAQICEIHQLGLRKDTGTKLTMQEVAEYLFKCNGNVEMVMEMMKKDGIKIDITEKVWRTYDEREIAHVLMQKPRNSTQIQRRKRLIMAEYGLNWDVASRILDQIEAKRITRMSDREYERWILNTLNFKI